MIKVENVKVYNIARAVYSARNPLNSWAKSDSDLDKDILGPNDIGLAQRLISAGSEHRKFLRQIFVTMDITAPLYWISEFDTYKVGTVRNSCSFMHKGVSEPFKMDDFSTYNKSDVWEKVIESLNTMRDLYLDTKDKKIFEEIRCVLPSGYNQRYTVTMNYENILTMIKQRTGHRLTEWGDFIKVLWELPYAKELFSGVVDGQSDEKSSSKDD